MGKHYKYDLAYKGKTYLTIKEAGVDLGICRRKLRHRLRYSNRCLSTAMSKEWSDLERQPLLAHPHTYKGKTYNTIFQIAQEFKLPYVALTNLLRSHSLAEIIDNGMLAPKGTRAPTKN